MTTHLTKAKNESGQSLLSIFLSQLSSTNSCRHNRSIIIGLLEECQNQECDLIIFPEQPLFRGNYAEIKTFAKEENFFIDELSEFSIRYQSTIVWGGLPIFYSGKLYNTSLVIDASGRVIGNYKKFTCSNSIMIRLSLTNVHYLIQEINRC